MICVVLHHQLIVFSIIYDKNKIALHKKNKKIMITFLNKFDSENVVQIKKKSPVRYGIGYHIK